MPSGGSLDFYAAASAAIPLLLLTLIFQLKPVESYGDRAQVRFLPSAYLPQRVFGYWLSGMVIAAVAAEVSAFAALFFGPGIATALIVWIGLLWCLLELGGHVVVYILVLAPRSYSHLPQPGKEAAAKASETELIADPDNAELKSGQQPSEPDAATARDSTSGSDRLPGPASRARA